MSLVSILSWFPPTSIVTDFRVNKAFCDPRWLSPRLSAVKLLSDMTYIQTSSQPVRSFTSSTHVPKFFRKCVRYHDHSAYWRRMPTIESAIGSRVLLVLHAHSCDQSSLFASWCWPNEKRALETRMLHAHLKTATIFISGFWLLSCSLSNVF